MGLGRNRGFDTIYKKTILLASLIILTISVAALSDESCATESTDKTTEGGITYILNGSDNTATASWDGSSAEVTVKSAIQKGEKSYAVSNIEVFSENETVTKITIEANKNIALNSEQFSKCTALNTIVLGEGITAIPSKFCMGTPVSSVSLPSTLTSIGSEAFMNCGSLKSIDFPAALNTIENKAFNTSGLTSVVISKNITAIGDAAFYNCTNIENLTFSTDTITNLSSIFGNLSALKTLDYNADTLSDYFKENNKLTSVKIDVKTIGSKAFNKCVKLEKVEIAEGLESIAGSAFSGCTSLTTINLPESVTEWGVGIFNGCSVLESINLPSSMKTIPNNMFNGCNKLATIELPEVTSIGTSAFGYCKALTSVQIPSTVTKIGDNAFTQCISLASITLGEHLKSIGVGAFYNTKLLEITIPAEVNSITFAKDNNVTFPSTLSAINVDSKNTTYSVKDNIVYSNDQIVFCISAKTGELCIDTDVAAYAFVNSQLSKVVFTDKVKSIGEYAFKGAALLKEVVFSESIETIGMSAFFGCDLLQALTLPSKVDIDWNALPTSLKYVSFGNEITGWAFDGLYELTGGEFELYDANGTLIEESNLQSVKGKRFVWKGAVDESPTKLYEMTDDQVLITTCINGDLSYCAADKNKVYAPTDPTTVPEHYASFAGWYCDSAYTQEYNKTVAITADTVIYAKFNPETHTVKYLVDGEAFGDVNTYDYGSEVTLLNKYVKTGYTVTDWVYPEGLEVSDDGKFTIGSADIVFTATTKINQYTITFDTAGGSAIKSITQDYNSSVTAPSATKDGYTFIQWTLNGEAYTIGTMPAEDITLKAVWIKNYAADSESGAVIIDAADSNGFIPSADTKVVTVNLAKDTSVKVEDAKNLAGKTVASKITKISNASDKAGTAYEFIFTADSVQYTGKILVTLPYTSESGKQPAIYYWNGTESQKMNVVSSTDTSVTFETDHNSQYIVTMEDAPESSNNIILIAIAAIVVILAIIGVLYYRKTQQQQ